MAQSIPSLYIVPGQSPYNAPYPAEEQQASKIGLALGGGFARGLAHIGILRVLEEERIRVGFIAGTSIGALIGAIYCSGVKASEMASMARGVKFSELARWTLSGHDSCANERLTAFVRMMVKSITFEELSIPLLAVAADFATGEPVVLQSGLLHEAIQASCAYPGMFTPVAVDGRLLIDGVLAHPVPARPLRDKGCNPVLAVHLKGSCGAQEISGHMLGSVRRSFVSYRKEARSWRSWADLIVEPDVSQYGYNEFGRGGDLIMAGEKAMSAALPYFRAHLNNAKQIWTNPA